jgi:hypothetical protein
MGQRLNRFRCGVDSLKGIRGSDDSASLNVAAIVVAVHNGNHEYFGHGVSSRLESH